MMRIMLQNRDRNYRSIWQLKVEQRLELVRLAANYVIIVEPNIGEFLKDIYVKKGIEFYRLVESVEYLDNGKVFLAVRESGKKDLKAFVTGRE